MQTNRLRGWIERHPISSYLVLCYGISWSVWFAIPLVAGGQWTIMKVLVAIGMGPGLAAVLLDHLRGTAGEITGRWRAHFAVVFLAVAALNMSSLLTGDGITSEEFAAAHPVGLSAIGIAGSLAAAAVCGFIFASAAASRSRSLNSIVAWRVPLRWWLTALFLPAGLLIVSAAVAMLSGESLPAVHGGLSVPSWIGFVSRATLFTFLAVAIGEEPGWRGWLLPELQKRFSPLRSSIMLGVVWGLWHFPLFVIGAYPGSAEKVLEYLFLGPLLAILFTWMYNRTGGNLLLPMLLHTAINNSPRALPTTELFPILFTALAIVLVFTERMWRRRAISSTPAP